MKKTIKDIPNDIEIVNTIIGVGVKKKTDKIVVNIERCMVELPNNIRKEIEAVILKHYPNGIIPKEFIKGYTTWDYKQIK